MMKFYPMIHKSARIIIIELLDKWFNSSKSKIDRIFFSSYIIAKIMVLIYILTIIHTLFVLIFTTKLHACFVCVGGGGDAPIKDKNKFVKIKKNYPSLLMQELSS